MEEVNFWHWFDLMGFKQSNNFTLVLWKNGFKWVQGTFEWTWSWWKRRAAAGGGENMTVRGKSGCLRNVFGFGTEKQSRLGLRAEVALKHAHPSALTLMYREGWKRLSEVILLAGCGGERMQTAGDLTQRDGLVKAGHAQRHRSCTYRRKTIRDTETGCTHDGGCMESDAICSKNCTPLCKWKTTQISLWFVDLWSSSTGWPMELE